MHELYTNDSLWLENECRLNGLGSQPHATCNLFGVGVERELKRNGGDVLLARLSVFGDMFIGD